MTFTLNRLRHCTDTSPADWIGPRLTDWASGVTSVVPSGFEAYARVLHRPTGDDGPPVRWADVATFTGRTAHPLMQWHVIEKGVPGRPDWTGAEPWEGLLDEPQLHALCDLLSDFTATPEVAYHALWNGFGGGWSGRGGIMTWDDDEPPAVYRDDPARQRPDESETVLPPEVTGGPLVELPNREYHLFSGPVAAAGDFVATLPFDQAERQTPQLWWPADHAWCVATEIDFDSTLVGGTQQVVDAIVTRDALEAYQVPPDGDLTYVGDVVNDPTGELSRDW